MKMTKYLFGLALLALGMTMASCDKENEGAIYTSAHNNVSWEQKAMETTTAEESIVVPVMITRNTKAGALTVSYTAESSDPDVLSDDGNGTVTFADGDATAFVNVKATGMEKGTTYTYTMKLDDGAVADADPNTNNVKQTVTVTIVSDYTWVDGGVCIFFDRNFADGSTGVEVPVIKALENSSIIRFPNPYLAIYGGNPEDAAYFASSDDITVTFFGEPDDNDNVGEISTGGIMGEYTIEYLPDLYPSYCYFIGENGSYNVGHLIGVDGTPTYVGGFSFIYPVEQ